MRWSLMREAVSKGAVETIEIFEIFLSIIGIRKEMKWDCDISLFSLALPHLLGGLESQKNQEQHNNSPSYTLYTWEQNLCPF